MSVDVVKLSGKGQVTIPVDVRRALGLNAGDKVAFIEERSPETVKEYRERIEVKIKELIGDVHIDEQRLLTETAIFADKVAVAEETVRLRSHIGELCSLFETG